MAVNTKKETPLSLSDIYEYGPYFIYLLVFKMNICFM